MRRLPKSEVTMEVFGDYIIVGAHENHGYVYKTKVQISDVPNELVSLDDLKSLGVDVITEQSFAT